jgi:hypothetical protein
MHRPVNFDHEPGHNDRKIHEIAAAWMLPPDRETEWPQFAQSIPRHLLWRIRHTPQTPRAVNVRVARQGAILSYKCGAPSPFGEVGAPVERPGLSPNVSGFKRF